MQKHESIQIKKTARLMIGVCGILFCLFSFSFLYGMQSDVLSMSQHLLSKGRTTYSNMWGATIITSLLMLIVILFRRARIFAIHSQALYFFPSCLILGLITCIVQDRGWDYTFHVSWISLTIYILLYLFVVWISLHYPDTRNSAKISLSQMRINLILLALQFYMVGSIGNSNDAYHYELKTENLIMEGENSTALTIGKKSLATNRNLTALRVFALSRMGELGNKLFEYPQEYGSNGLLPNTYDSISAYNWTQQLYKHLGGYPGKGISTAKQFLEILSRHDNARPATHDYLLCAYLLDKELDKFVMNLLTFYTINDSLPAHYKEALIIYSLEKGEDNKYFTDKSVEENIKEYNNFAKQITDSIVRSNKCRREYGHTYWWYYHFK